MDRVFVRHGSYHIDLGRDAQGKRHSTRLSRLADGETALYAALAQFTKPKATTIGDLLTAFLAKGMKGLSPRTQLDYCNYVKRQLRPVFGDMTPEDLRPTHVAQYLHKRSDKASSSANKEIACLSSALEFGQRLGLCDGNPCRHVRRNKTRPKARYVRDGEFLAIFNAAPDHLQDLMAGFI